MKLFKKKKKVNQKINGASVTVMLSYDYNHFEISLSSNEELDVRGVNGLRKTAQRLADEAVRQYRVAKEKAAKRECSVPAKKRFLEDVEMIMQKQEGERTVSERAMLKQYEDEEWEKQFDCSYDYDDDLFFEE